MKRELFRLIPEASYFLLFTFHFIFCLISQLIENRLELQANGFKRRVVGSTRNLEWVPKEKNTFGEWIGDHIAIPAREEFFFEQANTIGTMGSPVALANCTTPSLATWRGPFGPSGVTPRSQPDRPNLINVRKAVAPPLVLDPRTV